MNGLLLCAGLVFAHGPVAAQTVAPNSLIWYEQRIARELDPEAAERFLKDQPLQEDLKKNQPQKLADLFLTSAQLKDFKDTIAVHADAVLLRDALWLRLQEKALYEGWPAKSIFLDDVQRLVDWTDKNVPAKKNLVREALWDWPLLSSAKKDWLAAQKIDEARWKALPFRKRQESLRSWVSALFKEFMAAAPKTAAQLSAMRAQDREIRGALTGDERKEASTRLEAAQAAVDALAELEKNSKVLGDPQLKKTLEEGKTSKSLDDTLADLGKLYDNGAVAGKSAPGPAARAVEAHRPATDQEKLSETDRAVVEGALGAAFLDEIKGTDAGDTLIKFYQSHPLKVRVSDLRTNIGEFRSGAGELHFSEKKVLEWMKLSSRKAQDLVKDRKAFGELVMMLTPTFVHEAWHQSQRAWAAEQGIPYWNGHHTEVEAMEIEALYMLQKSARSSDYKAFLEKAQESSSLVKADLARAQHLLRNPREFRDYMVTNYYNEWPSLEGRASGQIIMDADLAARAKTPEHYRKYQARYADANRRVEEALTKLAAGSPKPKVFY